MIACARGACDLRNFRLTLVSLDQEETIMLRDRQQIAVGSSEPALGGAAAKDEAQPERVGPAKCPATTTSLGASTAE